MAGSPSAWQKRPHCSGVQQHHVDEAVLGLEGLRGREVQVAVARALGPLAGIEIDRDRIRQEAEARPDEAHVHVLAQPVRKRCTSAALTMPKVMYDAATSETEPPTRVGGSPGMPVSAMSPLMPWAIVL